MKRISIVLFIILLMFISGCTKTKKAEETQKKLTFETERQKESYAVGFRNGIQLYGMVKNDDIDFDVALQGIKDAVNEQPQLPKREMTKIYARFKDRLQKNQEERRKAEAQKNKVDGEKFLEENVGKEGVIVTNSGLQYQVLKEGTGPAPKETDLVSVHYRGFLIDGREFVDTRKREGAQPVKLPVGRSLPFWKEGLPLMKVGASYRFFIPPTLAYQEYGNPPLIGANAVLVYEVELLGIE